MGGEVIRGSVVLHPHIMPALRTVPRVGDVVLILAGKHAGRTGKVTGRLDFPEGVTRWAVARSVGVMMGQYGPEQLSIIMEGS